MAKGSFVLCVFLTFLAGVTKSILFNSITNVSSTFTEAPFVKLISAVSSEGNELEIKWFNRSNPARIIMGFQNIFRNLTFECRSSYPSEWIFECPNLDSLDVHISKALTLHNGKTNYISIITIIQTLPPDSVRDLMNFTCRNANKSFNSVNTSVVNVIDFEYKKKLCNQKLFCLQIDNSSDFPDFPCGFIPSNNTNPGSGSNCNLALWVYSNQAQYSFYPSDLSCVIRYCDNLDYCASLVREHASWSRCVFKSSAVSKAPNLQSISPLPKKPGVVSCTFNGNQIMTPFFVVPKYLINKEPEYNLHWDLTEALKDEAIINLNSIAHRSTYYERESIIFECLATLSLFAEGFEWSSRESLSGASSQLYGFANQTVKDLKKHQFITRINITLKGTNVTQIICSGPIINSMEWRNASYNIKIHPGQRPRIFFNLTESKNDTITLHCKANGGPVPTWEWQHNIRESKRFKLRPNISETLDETSTKLTIQHDSIGNVTCKAVSVNGIDSFTFELSKNGRIQEASETFAAWNFPLHWIIVLVMAIIIMIALPTFVIIYWMKQKQNDRILSEKEIEDFLNGAPSATSALDPMSGALLLPYDTSYEIPREMIILEETVLGAGQYGIVVKGKFREDSVAIKTVRATTEVAYFKALLSELKILQFIGSHPHIVNILGACTGSIRKNYFHERGPEIIPLYQNSMVKELNSKDLIRLSYEIADAMSFIANKKILHGDLAARNVLITDSKSAKLCDFGLSKQLYQYSVYVQKLECPLPLRWMAVESLRDMEFSIESDVWSFGITMWEIFTLAELPYPGVNWGFESWKMLRDGYRLEKPDYSNLSIYALMKECWILNPKERPKFSYLAEAMKRELDLLR